VTKKRLSEILGDKLNKIFVNWEIFGEQPTKKGRQKFCETNR